jgi:hypothetical protein
MGGSELVAEGETPSNRPGMRTLLRSWVIFLELERGRSQESRELTPHSRLFRRPAKRHDSSSAGWVAEVRSEVTCATSAELRKRPFGLRPGRYVAAVHVSVPPHPLVHPDGLLGTSGRYLP